MTENDIDGLAAFHRTGKPQFNALSERAKLPPIDKVARAIAAAPDGMEIEHDCGVTFTVNGTYKARLPATHIDPPEPSEFEVSGVYLGGVEISGWLDTYAPGVMASLIESALEVCEK